MSQGQRQTQPQSQPTLVESSKIILTEHQSADHDEEAGELVHSSKELVMKDAEEISFGKNLVLLQTKACTLFLGPDYLCFLPTFAMFVFFSYLIIAYIDNNVEHPLPKIATKIVCITQCLSYLAVALSDPGIARPNASKNGTSRTVYCRKCQFNVPSRSFHCIYCDVCIEGYDHHCPWTSKCIGKNNLIRFYVFLFMTPIFIVYCAFAFGFTIQFEQMNRQQQLQMSNKG